MYQVEEKSYGGERIEGEFNSFHWSCFCRFNVRTVEEEEDDPFGRMGQQVRSATTWAHAPRVGGAAQEGKTRRKRKVGCGPGGKRDGRGIWFDFLNVKLLKLLKGGFSTRNIKTFLSVAPVLSTLWFAALAGLLIEINRLFPDALSFPFF